MLSVYEITTMLRCPRLGWSVFHEEKPACQEPYANLIVPFHPLVEKKLKIRGLPRGKYSHTMEKTMSLLAEKKGGAGLRFEYDGVYTRIPFLIPYTPPVLPEEESDKEQLKPKPVKRRKLSEIEYEIVYPYLSGMPQDKELIHMALDDYILRQNGIRVAHRSVVSVNRDFVRGEDLDPDQLLVHGDSLFKKSGHPFSQTVDEQLKDLDFNVEEAISQARAIAEQDQPAAVRCRWCMAPRKCGYFDQCFNESSLPDTSIQFLTSASKRQEMEAEGKDRLKEADPYRIEGLPLQYTQILADRNNGQFVDSPAISNWIETLEYPYIYLDFEWDTFAFPPYERMKPFDVLCFEFSMHIEKEDGSLEHIGFFSGEDGRRNFIETLLNNIPEQGSVIVYNMEGAEKLRLMQLAEQFPEYRERLEQICERMVDLSILFEKGAFYDIRQRGHYSLKTILSIFDQGPGYSKLSVRNGLEAIEAFRKYTLSRDEIEKEKLARRIDDYCAMDTEAELIILKELKKRIQKEDVSGRPGKKSGRESPEKSETEPETENRKAAQPTGNENQEKKSA